MSLRLKIDKKCVWSGSIKADNRISLLTNNAHDAFEIGLIHRHHINNYEWIAFSFVGFVEGNELDSGTCNTIREAKSAIVDVLKKHNVIE